MHMHNNKIEDFGEKIGGARKDMYASKESLLQSVDELNENERKKYLKKDKLWKLPPDKERVEAGQQPFVVFWQRTVRKMITSEPRRHYDDPDRWKIYTETLLEIRDKVMDVKTEDDIKAFYDYLRNIKSDPLSGMTDKLSYICLLYDITKIEGYHNWIRRKIAYTNFPYGNEKTTSKKRKENFCPPQLEFVNRSGEDYRHNIDVTPEMWQKKFNFRGVEFGNWMSQADRQTSMNMCYDALLDLCRIIGVTPESITFSGKLAIAFGARGMSRALAHYEPLREVINLTKMRGAGSTAHEWFHALDHHIAILYDINNSTLASEYSIRNRFPKSFQNLIDSCKYNETGQATDFYRNSRKFDKNYSKDSHGYWSSNCEMLARAFACYCHDRYDGNSDYLYAHSESCVMMDPDGEILFAIPKGEERERINKHFDIFFEELKNLKILTECKYDKVEEEKNLKPKYYNINTIADQNGQLSFIF